MALGAGSNIGAIALGGVAAVAIGVGAYFTFGSPLLFAPEDPETLPISAPVAAVEDTSPQAPTEGQEPVTPEATAAPEPASPEARPEADTASAAAPEPAEEPALATAMPAPHFDTIRIEADGTGILAGRAAPGIMIDILLDRVAIDRVQADGAGAFVAFLDLGPSDNPRMLSLMADPEGEAVASIEDRIVAPIAAPVVVAEAAPAATPDPTVDVPNVDTPTEPSSESVDADEVAQAPDALVEPAPEAAPVALADSVTDATETIPEGATNATVDVADAAETAVPTIEEIVETPAAVEEIVETPVDDVVVAETPVADAVEEMPEAMATPTEAVEETPEATPTPVEVVEATPTAPAVLSVGEEGVEVVQPAQNDVSPEVLSAIALDTITYDPDGAVLVAGRALQGVAVRIYLDNALITTTPVEEGRWRTELPQVDFGVYTLRADEVDDAGSVLSRIESPFKREEPAKVAAVLAQETAQDDFQIAVRTVQPGNTLWAIARDRYGEGIMYVHVFDANKERIRNPDLIYPGQVFLLPEIEE